MKNTIRFLFNGLKVNGKLYPAYLSKNENQSGEIIIYVSARNYGTFPAEVREAFNVKNDSDMMTDYFETDSFTIGEDSVYWKDALAAVIKLEAKNQKRYAIAEVKSALKREMIPNENQIKIGGQILNVLKVEKEEEREGITIRRMIVRKPSKLSKVSYWVWDFGIRKGYFRYSKLHSMGELSIAR